MVRFGSSPSLADTNPETPADGMAYFRHEFTAFKKDIKAMKDPNKDLKKKHIREWQSQLLEMLNYTSGVWDSCCLWS
jgi:hypothetical protein